MNQRKYAFILFFVCIIQDTYCMRFLSSSLITNVMNHKWFMPAVVVTSLVVTNALNFWHMTKKISAVEKHDNEILETWITKLKNIGVKVTKNDKDADLINEHFNALPIFLVTHGWEVNDEGNYINNDLKILQDTLDRTEKEKKELLLKVQKEKEVRNQKLNGIGVIILDEENEVFSNPSYDDLTKTNQSLIKKGFKYSDDGWDHPAIQELQIIKEAFGYGEKIQMFISASYKPETLLKAWQILGRPLTRKDDNYEHQSNKGVVIIRRASTLIPRPPSHPPPVMSSKNLSLSPRSSRHIESSTLSASEPILPVTPPMTALSQDLKQKDKIKRRSPPGYTGHKG